MGSVEKVITPFVKHALQLDRHDPLMAYYCRTYAAQKGIAMHTSAPSPEGKTALMALMDRLEKDKQALAPTFPTINPREYVTNFAVRVFDLADNEDREGKSSKTTARNFLSAAVFFDVLRQFDEKDSLPNELEEKHKYSKWKAANIATAIRQGVSPKPGGPGEQDGMPSVSNLDLQVSAPAFPSAPGLGFPSAPSGDVPVFPGTPQSAPPSLGYSHESNHSMSPPPPSFPQSPQPSSFPSTPNAQFPSTPPFPGVPGNHAPGFPSVPGIPKSQSPSFPSVPQPQQPQFQQQQYSAPPNSFTNPTVAQPAPQAATKQVHMPAPIYATRPTNSTPGVSDEELEQALKFSRYAVSALLFEDVPTAIKNLKLALEKIER